MTRIFVIVDENGTYLGAYADSEVDFQLLKKGKDDNEIDRVETELEALDE